MFCALQPRGCTAGVSITYNLRFCCQRVARLKGLKISLTESFIFCLGYNFKIFFYFSIFKFLVLKKCKKKRTINNKKRLDVLIITTFKSTVSIFRSSYRRCSINAQKSTCVRVSLLVRFHVYGTFFHRTPPDDCYYVFRINLPSIFIFNTHSRTPKLVQIYNLCETYPEILQIFEKKIRLTPLLTRRQIPIPRLELKIFRKYKE